MNGWWIFESADVAALPAAAPWAQRGSRISIAPAEAPAAVFRKMRRDRCESFFRLIVTPARRPRIAENAARPSRGGAGQENARRSVGQAETQLQTSRGIRQIR